MLCALVSQKSLNAVVVYGSVGRVAAAMVGVWGREMHTLVLVLQAEAVTATGRSWARRYILTDESSGKTR